MARRIFLVVIKCICFFTCFYCFKFQLVELPPTITSVTLLNKTFRNLESDSGADYSVKIEGVNLNPRMLIRLTTYAGDERNECHFRVRNSSHDSKTFLHPRLINETVGFFSVIISSDDFREPLYLCVGAVTLNPSINVYRRELIKWIHQGRNVFILNDNYQNNTSERFFINTRLDIFNLTDRLTSI